MAARSYHAGETRNGSARRNCVQNAATTSPVLRSLLVEMELERRAVGQRIAALRKKRRWTQDDAKDAIGVSLRAYQDWEAGRAIPRWRNLERLTETFEVDASDILGEERSNGGDPISAQLNRIEAKLDDVLGHWDARWALLETELVPESDQSAPQSARESPSKGSRRSSR
jgi:putative transcriptional regulator